MELRPARKIAVLRRQLLQWYARHRRDLPWRNTADPYSIWISEIMLQQTRVAVVIERYREFVNRFPTLLSLASANEDDVLALWSGLGYYRRARMLHKAAQAVTSQHGGIMPQTAHALRSLPGIGSYTAAAIASIAHGEPVAVVDGNVERVLCRIEGWEGNAKTNTALRKQIHDLADRLVDPTQPGDFNQAIMELGATVCVPRNPQCLICPIATHCHTRGEHKTEKRKPMHSKQIAHALVLRTVRNGHAKQNQEVLLERRSKVQTVMPGLWELPALLEAEVPESELRLTVRHAIMQVNYLVHIRSVEEQHLDQLTQSRGERRWVSIEVVQTMPLTGLARKVLVRTGLLTSKREIANQAAARLPIG